MVAHLHGMQGVRGSSPLSSTKRAGQRPCPNLERGAGHGHWTFIGHFSCPWMRPLALGRSRPGSVGLAHLGVMDTTHTTRDALEPVFTIAELATELSVSTQALRARSKPGSRGSKARTTAVISRGALGDPRETRNRPRHVRPDRGQRYRRPVPGHRAAPRPGRPAPEGDRDRDVEEGCRAAAQGAAAGSHRLRQRGSPQPGQPPSPTSPTSGSPIWSSATSRRGPRTTTATICGSTCGCSSRTTRSARSAPAGSSTSSSPSPDLLLAGQALADRAQPALHVRAAARLTAAQPG